MPHQTRRIYFEDAYRTEFTARVLATAQYQDQPAVILDIFSPPREEFKK